MPWLLAFHIAALLCWCGALLYLPGLVMTQQRTAINTELDLQPPRFVYSLIATPAALAAIIAGTLVFSFYRIWDIWLIAKLLLVAALVLVHLLLGWLVARAERQPPNHLPLWCYSTVLLAGVIMTAIIWLVLAKPLRGT
ncbi:CopD family protein [Gilvimarinus agarilyticus]|uniref:CopD family protein n=1 Tax=unclassified Gilvimarinus TaxID=2642066 RepID=UPI001C08F137|nr:MULTISPECIES: CopD family protein [unclassified Gilvimarinus]MBU2886504.1 CopD family protein [Gilvimarinus agarilyticus]MDO6571172.1 CopD family protein [Gilvimarinus sp. 2_MG-2023]MDO6746447.1 CopD family protein [Gilvimarinus sp. 1_MG-2023]